MDGTFKIRPRILTGERKEERGEESSNCYKRMRGFDLTDLTSLFLLRLLMYVAMVQILNATLVAEDIGYFFRYEHGDNVISKERGGVHCLPLRIIPCLCPLGGREREREFRGRNSSIGKARNRIVRSSSNCSYKITGLRL